MLFQECEYHMTFVTCYFHFFNLSMTLLSEPVMFLLHLSLNMPLFPAEVMFLPHFDI